MNIYDIYIEANVYSLNVDDIADRVEYIYIENRRYRDRIYIYRGRIYMYIESTRYKVAKTHRMPYLHLSFSAKEPYN